MKVSSNAKQRPTRGHRVALHVENVMLGIIRSLALMWDGCIRSNHCQQRRMLYLQLTPTLRLFQRGKHPTKYLLKHCRSAVKINQHKEKLLCSISFLRVAVAEDPCQLSILFVHDPTEGASTSATHTNIGLHTRTVCSHAVCPTL